MVAASSILGMMLALITAVRVRTFRPYSLEISLVAVAGRPISPQISTTRFSFFGSSTLKASAATKVCAPCSCSFWIAARMLPSRSGVLVSTYSLQLRRYLPSDSSMSPMVVSPLLFAPCRPLPSVMMPTGATSPSSRALVACVVPWAMKMTSSGRISHCSMTLCSTCTMPAATPSAAVWVVGTFTLPTTSKVSLSMATASVNKAKTSCFSFFFAAFRARADPDIRMGGPSISRRWNDKRAGYSDRPCSGLRTARCRRLVGEKTTQK